jgi:beta-lactamase class A
VRLPDLAPAEWSVLVSDADSGATLAASDEHRMLRTASVGKVFLLVHVAGGAAAGDFDLNQRVGWLDDERVEDSGLWYRLDQRDLTVRDLCVLVGAVSDNLATNALIRVAGKGVTATTEALGYSRSALLDRVRDHRGPGDAPTLSVGNAAELSDLMGRLHRGEAFGPAVSTTVLGWLRANTDLSMVASAFGLDPLAHVGSDRGVRLANKTGTISTARADVGVVEGPVATVAYAVLASWGDGEDLRDAVLRDMHRIGSLIRDHIGG